ncbi:hypothetical protein Tco_1103589 [Tanacetum coccineum]
MLLREWMLRPNGHPFDPYAVYIDKPKPLGDNEVTEETFDPLFCDLDPETGEPNATEFHSEVPYLIEPSEVPNGHWTSVGRNEVPIEDTQPVDAEVFEDLDLEDFDNASDLDDIECNRKKALRMLAKKHKPVDGNIYSENFYCGQTFANKELIKQMVSRLAVENRRQLWLSKNENRRQLLWPNF